MGTAAVVIIGNEILSGKFADENTPFLVGRLRALGVDLRRIVVIPDEIDVIAETIRACSHAFDWVLSTGGVGPTHDDLTFPGIARAFGLDLARNDVLAGIIGEKLGERANEAAFRMAEIPDGAALWWDGDVIYPLVTVRNVLVFPGVPSLVRLKFDAIAHRLAGVPLASARLVTHADEPAIAEDLSHAAGRWPGVAIGSYPRFDESPRVVIVTLEGRDAEALAACRAWLEGRLPA
jgi:molybdenum cofactor synthesis domain-containing protein